MDRGKCLLLLAFSMLEVCARVEQRAGHALQSRHNGSDTTDKASSDITSKISALERSLGKIETNLRAEEDDDELVRQLSYTTTWTPDQPQENFAPWDACSADDDVDCWNNFRLTLKSAGHSEEQCRHSAFSFMPPQNPQFSKTEDTASEFQQFFSYSDIHTGMEDRVKGNNHRAVLVAGTDRIVGGSFSLTQGPTNLCGWLAVLRLLMEKHPQRYSKLVSHFYCRDVEDFGSEHRLGYYNSDKTFTAFQCLHDQGVRDLIKPRGPQFSHEPVATMAGIGSDRCIPGGPGYNDYPDRCPEGQENCDTVCLDMARTDDEYSLNWYCSKTGRYCVGNNAFGYSLAPVDLLTGYWMVHDWKRLSHKGSGVNIQTCDSSNSNMVLAIMQAYANAEGIIHYMRKWGIQGCESPVMLTGWRQTTESLLVQLAGEAIDRGREDYATYSAQHLYNHPLITLIDMTVYERNFPAPWYSPQLMLHWIRIINVIQLDGQAGRVPSELCIEESQRPKKSKEVHMTAQEMDNALIGTGYYIEASDTNRDYLVRMCLTRDVMSSMFQKQRFWGFSRMTGTIATVYCQPKDHKRTKHIARTAGMGDGW